MTPLPPPAKLSAHPELEVMKRLSNFPVKINQFLPNSMNQAMQKIENVILIPMYATQSLKSERMIYDRKLFFISMKKLVFVTWNGTKTGYYRLENGGTVLPRLVLIKQHRGIVHIEENLGTNPTIFLP